MDVKRSSLVISILVLLSAFSLTLTIIPENAKAGTLYVGGTGPGNFTKIQDAIDSSIPGDTIYVYNGTYAENIVIAKSLSLVGEGTNVTTIDGMGSGDVINISADGVNITGFSLINSGVNSGDVGIELYSVRDCIINLVAFSNMTNFAVHLIRSNQNIVSHSQISNSRTGIYLELSDANIISDNVISSSSSNVYMRMSRSNVVVNNVLSNGSNGIQLSGSDNNLIANNTILDNSYGVYFYFSQRNVLLNNTFIEDGIFIYGSLSYWNTHIIDPSNTINGKPLYYWKNVTGGKIPSGSGQVILANCTQVMVENQNVSNGSVGILLGHSSNNIISNNTASSNGWYGIYLDMSDGNTIANNTVSQNGEDGLQLFFSNGNTVDGNTFSDGTNGIKLYSSGSNTILSNNISSNTQDGLALWSSSIGNVLSNNTIFDNIESGIDLRFSYVITISNNTISNNQDGIYIDSASHSTLSGNSMFNDGVYMRGSNLNHWNTHIIDPSNTVNGKPLYYWKNATGGKIPTGSGQVILANCTNVIVENQAISNGSVGILLGHSSNNIISNNTASSNGWYGIRFDMSVGNTVMNNTLSKNEGGIYFAGSHANSIIGNTMSNNTEGFRLFISNSNTIHHNNFMYNLLQAYDGGEPNQWSDDYPSGGNYWSDYAGSDVFSGPDQDHPGSDGIGDTPYMVDMDSEDKYPLVAPTGFLRPRPPMSFQASLSGVDLENITLNWSTSPDDGMGFYSVIGYEIYRNATYDAGGQGYGRIASLPNGTSNFLDVYVGKGDSNNYFYLICAMSLGNSTACALSQAGKFTRPLSKGTNLVSIPLIQSDGTIQTALQTVSYDNAWSYDPINQEWKSLSKSKPYGQSLEYVNHTTAIWVNVTQDSNLTVAGVVPTSTTIDLQAGWNLVGFPSFDDNYTVTDLKTSVVVERIEGFDALAPPYLLRVMNDVDFLQAGFGYWIRVESPAIWTVENT